MDEFDRPLEPHLRAEQHGNVRIVLDDIRQFHGSEPVTIRIILMEAKTGQLEPRSPLVRVIHEDELAQMMVEREANGTREEEVMTFGEGVTLLIAMGVLVYLIYALLWPERF